MQAQRHRSRAHSILYGGMNPSNPFYRLQSLGKAPFTLTGTLWNSILDQNNQILLVLSTNMLVRTSLREYRSVFAPWQVQFGAWFLSRWEFGPQQQRKVVFSCQRLLWWVFCWNLACQAAQKRASGLSTVPKRWFWGPRTRFFDAGLLCSCLNNTFSFQTSL